MKTSTRTGISGFALIEMMVASAALVVVGGLGFAMLNSGLTLFAKNTAINLAHQQARVAVIKVERDLHASVSLPQLCDLGRNAVAGSGPAAGISFQLFAAGPFKVTALAPAGQNRVTLGLGSFQAKAGQRLVIPTHHIEIDLAQDCSGSGNRQVILASNLPRDIEIQLDNAGTPVSVNVIGFITERVSYVVNNGRLLQYRSAASSQYTVLANDITSAQPFSTPSTPAGAPYYRFVAAINLSTADLSSNQRKFKSANMFLNTQVPCRARLCSYQ